WQCHGSFSALPAPNSLFWFARRLHDLAKAFHESISLDLGSAFHNLGSSLGHSLLRCSGFCLEVTGDGIQFTGHLQITVGHFTKIAWSADWSCLNKPIHGVINRQFELGGFFPDCKQTIFQLHQMHLSVTAELLEDASLHLTPQH